jgi:hypothetical protein
VSLRSDSLYSGGRPRDGRNLSLRGLPSLLRVAVSRKRPDKGRRFPPVERHPKDLCQNRGQRRKMSAGLLWRMRLADLRVRCREAEDPSPAARRPQAAIRDSPASPDLSVIGAAVGFRHRRVAFFPASVISGRRLTACSAMRAMMKARGNFFAILERRKPFAVSRAVRGRPCRARGRTRPRRRLWPNLPSRSDANARLAI